MEIKQEELKRMLEEAFQLMHILADNGYELGYSVTMTAIEITIEDYGKGLRVTSIFKFSNDYTVIEKLKKDFSAVIRGGACTSQYENFLKNLITILNNLK